MKNIHVLSTDKPRTYKGGKVSTFTAVSSMMPTEFVSNIYITNSEEIKEEDYWYDYLLETINKGNLVGVQRGKKVIMTTDQNLIKNGVQAIGDEFLEWFVNNPTCEEVMVDKFISERYFCTNLIIPKEEPKQETLEELADKWVFETNGHKWSNNNNEAGDNFGSFIDGFKEAEKTLYSGEEVLELLITCKNRFGGSGLEDYTHDDEVEEWFEQFKKK